MFFWKKEKSSHERALDWFKANMVPGQGIIVHTRQPVPYPEVTGYFIPTLYNWNEPELARTCTRGLCAAVGDVVGAEDALRRASDWMLTQVDPSGRLLTPSTELWTDSV